MPSRVASFMVSFGLYRVFKVKKIYFSVYILIKKQEQVIMIKILSWNFFIVGKVSWVVWKNFPEFLSILEEFLSVLEEFLSILEEFLSILEEFLSILEEFLSILDG